MKTNLILLLILLPLLATTQVHTVKQDGTGDYTTIQAAVTAAQNGDTVLVWPGTYYENVDFLSKNLTLASRMLTTGDENYKYNTIIDGHQNGSCILIKDYVTDATVHGLTLTHGSGYETNGAGFGSFVGGGICIHYHSSCLVNNCIIKNNNVKDGGGGIVIGISGTLTLKNNIIKNNHAGHTGGGVSVGYLSTIVIDTIELNSIYLNYASKGNDMHKLEGGALYVKLDTGTIFNPDPYYFSLTNMDGYQTHDYTFNILHQKITPLDTNLYVNPATGNDSNSGVNPNEALKTIAFANTKIIPDSNNRNTIFLANGTYSDTLNGEKFPLNIRSYINVEGESRDGTILDGEYKYKLFKANNEICNVSISKMTMKRPDKSAYQTFFQHGVIDFYRPDDSISIDSVLFTEGWSKNGNGNVCGVSTHGFSIENCEFSNNTNGAALRMSTMSMDTIYINNCSFTSNKPYFDTVPDAMNGRALNIMHAVSIITNSLFVDNDYQALITPEPGKNYIVNCTFTENSFERDFRAPLWLDDSHNYMYNCIVYNNNYYDLNGVDKTILLTNVDHEDTTVFYVKNSLIDGGEETILIDQGSCNGDCFYYYDTTNIDTDPLFYGGPDFPYNLSDESPCIDAGTLDLPQFVLDHLPDVDLAGNPRIVNDKIDMGCYEWNPTVGTDEHRISNTEHRTPNLKAFPNPFSTTTYIAARWETAARVNIEVYNNTGLLVKTLQSGKQFPGSCQIPWNGTDNTGNYLPSGVYVIILRIDGIETESVKVVKN